MDVTPQLLKDVEFREKKFGGYDPDEVDDFLERVGVAIGQLQMRLREMTQRAEAAETRLAEQPVAPPPVQGGGEVDDTLRRTLLLAQRTADAAVAEAQEEATRIVGAAQDEAERIRGEDLERHERELQESQDEIRRAGDETRQRVLQEITELESIRDQLMSDVEILERHVDDERARLQTTVATLSGLLDAAGSLAPLERPAVSGVIPPREPVPNFDAPGGGAAFDDEAGYDAAPEEAPDAGTEFGFDTGYEPPPEAPAPAFEPAAFEPATFEAPGPSPEAAPEPAPAWGEPAEPVFAADPAGGADLFAQPPPPPPPPGGGTEASGFGGLGGPGGPSGGRNDPWADLPGANVGLGTQPMGEVGDDNPWVADLAREEAANQPPPPVPETDEDAMAEWYRQQQEAGGGKGEKKRFGRKK